MSQKRGLSLCVLALVFLTANVAGAAIVGISESGLGTDTPAILEVDPNLFGEDMLSFSDRTHQHNGAAYNSVTGLLTTTVDGDTVIVPLPDYLVGGEYVRMANNARDNGSYELSITVDTPSYLYVLIDNRLDGPNDNKNHPNTTPPVLGGDLQWLIDDGYVMMNTGIMPDGQPDFTGVDESGDGTGPGQGLNQFYTIFMRQIPAGTSTTSQQGIGSSNMYSVVVTEVPEPATMGLLAIGALGVLIRRKRR
jgi:hypothetical protein